MKKAFFFLFVATFAFASCDNGGSSEGDNTGSTDTTATVKPDVVSNPNTAEDNAPAGPTTVMTFPESEFNFGKITEGDIVEHTFAFTNDGDHDLIITNAKGSCGCTIPYYPTEPIAPGETSEIKVSFNSKGKHGVQRKTVTITANTDPAQTVLNLVSEVSPADEGNTK